MNWEDFWETVAEDHQTSEDRLHASISKAALEFSQDMDRKLILGLFLDPHYEPQWHAGGGSTLRAPISLDSLSISPERDLKPQKAVVTNNYSMISTPKCMTTISVIDLT
jgi:hypothetical protein